jgi:acyl homoserine lactone synthase
MKIASYTDDALTSSNRRAIARYRYRVFVGQLGWDLPVPQDSDQDQFDNPHTRHLVAYDRDEVIGYARLLPTSQPYVLKTLFPELLNGLSAPEDDGIWELSRYAATDLRHGNASVEMSMPVGKAVLLEAMRFVHARGAHTLVFCTTVAIERLSRRWGLDTQRLGPPRRSPAGLLVAAAIPCTEANMQLLSAAAEVCGSWITPAPATTNLNTSASASSSNSWPDRASC